MKTGTGLLILTAGAMLLLGGCGHGDTSGRQHEARLFGATYMTRNNPYFDVLNEGIEEVVEANGDILLTRDPLQDQEKQNGPGCLQRGRSRHHQCGYGGEGQGFRDFHY